MIKAVFFDIDGTLVSFKTHSIPDSTQDAISKLKQQGIKVFIASGRDTLEIHVLGDICFDGYMLLNGAYCIDGDKNVFYKKAIPASDMNSLIERQIGVDKFPCMIVQEHAKYTNFVNDRVLEMCQLVKVDVPVPVPFDVWKNEAKKEVLQLAAFISEEDEPLLMKSMPGCVSHRWSPLFTDILSHGVSKRTGIDQMLQHYNILLDEIIVFGDGGNDVEMLSYVPNSVAMGNATDSVKSTASYVTTSVDDNGIANGLRHFGLL